VIQVGKRKLARSTSRERAAGTKSTRSSTRITLGARARTSSAATRTMVRCRSTTSSGWCAAADASWSSTPAFPRNGCQARAASTCVADARPASARRRCGVGQGCRDHPTCTTTTSAISSCFRRRRCTCRTLEMQYATGRHMREERFRGAFEVEDVAGMVRRVYAGEFSSTTATRALSRNLAAPDRRAYLGPQVVRVSTRRGWVVLALGRQPFLRQHGAEPPLSHRLVGPRHGRGL